MSNLYNRLCELCEEKGITGYRMSKDAGVSVNLMTELKSGRKATLSAEKAVALAKYFDVSVAYLMGESDEKKDPADMSIDEVDAEVAEIYETIKDDEPMRVLFHAAKRATPEQRRAAIAMLKSFEGEQG